MSRVVVSQLLPDVDHFAGRVAHQTASEVAAEIFEQIGIGQTGPGKLPLQGADRDAADPGGEPDRNRTARQSPAEFLLEGTGGLLRRRSRRRTEVRDGAAIPAPVTPLQPNRRHTIPPYEHECQ